jgi:hypothetical protein
MNIRLDIVDQPVIDRVTYPNLESIAITANWLTVSRNYPAKIILQKLSQSIAKSSYCNQINRMTGIQFKLFS